MVHNIGTQTYNDLTPVAVNLILKSFKCCLAMTRHARLCSARKRKFDLSRSAFTLCLSQRKISAI